MSTPNITIPIPQATKAKLERKLSNVALPQDIKMMLSEMFGLTLDICYSAIGCSEYATFDLINAHTILLIDALDEIDIRSGSQNTYDAETKTLIVNPQMFIQDSTKDLGILQLVTALTQFLCVESLYIGFDSNFDFFSTLSQELGEVEVKGDENALDSLRVSISKRLTPILYENMANESPSDVDFRAQTARWFLSSKPSLISDTFAQQIDAFIEMQFGVVEGDLDSFQEDKSQIVSAMLDTNDVFVPSSFVQSFETRQNPMALQTIPQEQIVDVIKFKKTINLLSLGVFDMESVLIVFDAIYAQAFGITNQIPSDEYALFAIRDQDSQDILFVMKFGDTFYTLNTLEASWVLTL